VPLVASKAGTEQYGTVPAAAIALFRDFERIQVLVPKGCGRHRIVRTFALSSTSTAWVLLLFQNGRHLTVLVPGAASGGGRAAARNAAPARRWSYNYPEGCSRRIHLGRCGIGFGAVAHHDTDWGSAGSHGLGRFKGVRRRVV